MGITCSTVYGNHVVVVVVVTREREGGGSGRDRETEIPPEKGTDEARKRRKEGKSSEDKKSDKTTESRLLSAQPT